MKRKEGRKKAQKFYLNVLTSCCPLMIYKSFQSEYYELFIIETHSSDSKVLKKKEMLGKKASDINRTAFFIYEISAYV